MLAPMAQVPIGDKATVDGLADALQEAILSGELPSGTWLRQARLAEQYGLSRTPVREALRALQARRLVEVVPNRGAIVAGPTIRDVREAYAVRAELEGFAAELAAELASDAQIERLSNAEQLFRRAVTGAGAADADGAAEPPRWSDANDIFHEAVLDAAGNARLAETVRALHRSFPRNVTWAALRGNTHLLQENVEQHRAIARAIAARDQAAARRAMTEHVRRSGELVAMRLDRSE